MAKTIAVLCIGPAVLCEIYTLYLIGGNLLGVLIGIHTVFSLFMLYKIGVSVEVDPAIE